MQSLRQFKELRHLAIQDATRRRGARPGEEEAESEVDLEKSLAEDDGIDVKDGKLVVRSCGDDDPTDPHNWPLQRRIQTFCVLFLMVFAFGWVSSCDSDILKPMSAEMHVSEEAETLATALFMIGLASGALVAGPISETVGRNPVYFISMAVFCCFTLGAALSPNYGAQITFRFLSGVFSSPTLSMYGGSLADLFTPEERSLAWPVFALSAVLGPVVAPIAGGWIDQHIYWRWAYWIGLILSGFAFLVALLFLPETFSPVLLKWKAQHLRTSTSDPRYAASIEVEHDFVAHLKRNLSLPITFFTTEPIIIFLGAYLVVIYIVNFTFLNGFSFIFTDTYGLSPGITSLAFIGITIGALISTALMPLFWAWQKRLVREHQAAEKEKSSDSSSSSSKDKEHDKDGEDNHDEEEDDPRHKIGPPELRLLPAMFAAPCLAISLFWLGWTNYQSISYWSGYGATVLFGYALTAIFVSSYQYIIDAYETASSTALGSITLVRYLTSGGMIIVSRPMYENLGVHWSLTILGGLSVVLVPVPFVLWKYGKKIREKSQFAR